MAPTTLPLQITQTTPYGRNTLTHGYPLKMCEIISQINGPSYIERCALDTVKHIREAKRAVKKAVEYQIKYNAYSFIELLSACPTNWRLPPNEAVKRVGSDMADYYPLGVYYDKFGG